MHFSIWLKKRIQELGITQKHFAEQLQISPTTVSNWIHDRHTPDEPEHIVNIAVFFTENPQNIGNTLLSLMLSIQYTKQHPVKTQV